ncbi:hypothetical protein Tco_0822053 [Tanacetum coccineum]|uniref:Uncharacterized protein n=1 Tax=Tanacetum coccineum TaxID=301880 RepID=A0ABQ5AIF5_9ASTR
MIRLHYRRRVPIDTPLVQEEVQSPRSVLEVEKKEKESEEEGEPEEKEEPREEEEPEEIESELESMARSEPKPKELEDTGASGVKPKMDCSSPFYLFVKTRLKDVASFLAVAAEEKKNKHMVPSFLTMEWSKLLLLVHSAFMGLNPSMRLGSWASDICLKARFDYDVANVPSYFDFRNTNSLDLLDLTVHYFHWFFYKVELVVELKFFHWIFESIHTDYSTSLMIRNVGNLQALMNLYDLFSGFLNYFWSCELRISNFSLANRKRGIPGRSVREDFLEIDLDTVMFLEYLLVPFSPKHGNPLSLGVDLLPVAGFFFGVDGYCTFFTEEISGITTFSDEVTA